MTIAQEDLGSWCRQHLDAEPVATLFESGHLAAVIGLQLDSGRRVVVKARPPAARLGACVDVQRHLWASGFPCPEPLAGPAALGTLTATAESLVEGGGPLERGSDAAVLFAGALAELVSRAYSLHLSSTLDPAPAWVNWDHDEPGVWPPADDRDDDLNGYPDPRWLSEVANRARSQLRASRLPRVIGHADWYQANLCWIGRRLHVVHDWDSVVFLPEAAIAGSASAIYTQFAGAAASLLDSKDFLEAYEDARGRKWTDEEQRVCWASGVWQMAFDAKKQTLDGTGTSLPRLEEEAARRLELAGA